MSGFTPDILEAIAQARDTFRARGRPLPPDAVEDLAQAWLAAWRELERTELPGPGLWAELEVEDLHRAEPESALAVLGRALELAPGLDTEFLVFEQLRTLLQAQPEFAERRLRVFLNEHPSMRARVSQLCARGQTPPDWPPEVFAQLCASVAG
jgi:hypothetical protein